jgi:hypothetical protein
MSLFGIGVLATSVIMAMLVSNALVIMHSETEALNDTLAYENIAYVEAFAYSGSIFAETQGNSTVLYRDLEECASMDGINITQEYRGILIRTYSAPYAVSIIKP